MSNPTDIHEEIKKIVRFFNRTHSKYIFLVVDDQRILKDIITQVQTGLKEKDKEIGLLKLSAENPSIYRQVHDYCQENTVNGLIVSEVNLLIYRDPKQGINLLNKSRDAFSKFRIPIAFVVNSDNLKRIITGASDFYQFRHLPDFHFKGSFRRDEGYFDASLFDLDYIADSQLKAELFEEQLARINPPEPGNEMDDSTLNHIVVPLLKINIAQGNYKRTEELFDQYIKSREYQVKDKEVVTKYHKKKGKIGKHRLPKAETVDRHVTVKARESNTITHRRFKECLHQTQDKALHMEQDILKKYSKELTYRENYIKEGDWNRAAEITFEIGKGLALQDFYFKAKELLEELDLKKLDLENQLIFYNRIVVFCAGLGAYDQALSFAQEALEVEKSIDEPFIAAVTLFQMGIIYQIKGDYDAALEHYEQSLEIHPDNRFKNVIAGTITQLAHLYFEKEDYDNALKFFILAYKTFSELKSSNTKVAQKDISQVREKLPPKRFEEIMKEYGLELEE